MINTCCVAAILLTVGCGGIGSEQGGAAGHNATETTGGTSGTGGANTEAAGASAGVAPEICTQYGIEFSGDCSECPQTPLSCACFAGLPVFPETACTFGKCISAVDCDRVCRNAGDPSNPQPGDLANPDLGTDILAIQDCVDTLMHCDSGDDEDCGEGKCVFDIVARTGRCSTGEEFQGCKEPNDCQSGFCVGTNPEFGVCASGEAGAGCTTSDQCLAGTCLLYTPGPADFAAEGPGLCSSGLPNEPCITDEHCMATTHCVPDVPMRVLGSCSPGAVGDLCDDDDDCQSGYCFVWGDIDPQETGICTAGSFRDPCIDGTDCESGHCSRQIGNTTGGGSCVSGDALSPCFTDEACASSQCALLLFSDDPLIPYPVAEGLCTTGASGDPCQEDTECTSATCVNPDAVPSAACPFAPSTAGGTPCENGGVCNNTGTCFQGRCE